MAESLFNQLGLNKREARELVDLFFEEVRAALADGAQVKLSGFGNFDLRDKNRRPCWYPEDWRGDPHQRAARGDLPSGPETQGTRGSLCWNPGTITSCRPSRVVLLHHR